MQILALRVLAAIASPLILAATVSQGVISTQDMIRSGGDVADGVWRYLGYFTVLTNLLVVAILARAALAPGDRNGLNSPRNELMALTSILFVGGVYHALLASQWDPQGLQKLNDDLLHTWSPLAFAAFWLLRPRGALAMSDVLFAALWPTAYSLYGLGRGAVDGFYPYYFMDPTSTPWLMVARNMTGLVLAFVIGALALTVIDQALHKFKPQKGQTPGGREDKPMRTLVIALALAAIADPALAQNPEMDAAEQEMRSTMAPAGARVERVASDEVRLIMPSDITFDFNRAEVRYEFTPYLRDLARTLVRYPGMSVNVVGHADAIGSDAYNQRLSERRAFAVSDMLGRYGVEHGRIRSGGRGEWEPIATNAEAWGRARNRRVEISVKSAK